MREIRLEYVHRGQTYLTASHSQLRDFRVIFVFFLFVFFLSHIIYPIIIYAHKLITIKTTKVDKNKPSQFYYSS